MFFSKKILGVDIGSDAVKVVEIAASHSHLKLENYAEVRSQVISKDPLLAAEGSALVAASGVIGTALRQVVAEAKMKTKKAIFALPDFLTFAAFFEIPPMPEKEIKGAIQYNASRYLTLPMSEVTLDWKIVSDSSQTGPIKVFLVAVTKQVIKKYQEIAKIAGLELYALEAEVFGLPRVLAPKAKTVCLLDMGAKTTTINIISGGFLRRSYSAQFSASQIMNTLSSVLSVNAQQAEALAMKEGLRGTDGRVKNAIVPLVDALIVDIRSTAKEFVGQEQKNVDELYLTGGTSLLPGIKEYFAEHFKEVVLPNCFGMLSCPTPLLETLRTMAPRFSVAVGVAAGINEIR